MEREQFTFYRSWLTGINLIKNKSQRCDAYDVIIAYALDNQEADVAKLPTSAAIAYVMAKPIIDSGRKKAEAGRRGGEKPAEANDNQTASKPQAKPKQTEAKAKQEKGQDKGQVKEQGEEKGQMSVSTPPSDDGEADTAPPPPEARGSRSEAVRVYCELISPTPSPASMQELMEFERSMDTGCCLRAINAALDANARNWLYVRQILRDKQAAGIRTAEEWDRREAERMEAKARKSARAEEPDGFRGPADLGDNEAIFAEMEEWNHDQNT